MRFAPFPGFTALFFLLLGFSLPPTCAALPARADAAAAQSGPDVLVFPNGDKLSGKLDHVAGGKVHFKSDSVGKVKVKWDKLKGLRTAEPFAVIEKDVPVGRKKANLQIPIGTLDLREDVLTVATVQGLEKIPVANIAYVVSVPDFNHNVRQPQGLFHGVTGTVAAGLSMVSATKDSQSINIGIDLTRVVPAVSWMPPRGRTLLKFSSTYGRITEPDTPTVTTNILHGKLEQDEYFTPRLYMLEQGIFDHNVSQGLDLQQLYGIGMGFTPLNDSVQQLDLTASVSYTRQQLAASGTAPAVTKELIGSSLGDSFSRKLPGEVQLTQTASFLPAWNSLEDYSAHGMVGVTFPIAGHFGVSAEVVDDFLNNPVVGFKGNSFQFNTALTYSIQ